MPTSEHEERLILESWHANASPWITAIQEGQILSRREVTNQAILDTLLRLSPRCVLDIGCGEGWLTDALEGHGIPTVGTDAIPALLAFARQHRKGRFIQLDYDQLDQLTQGKRFDLAVCNFSLIGKESTETVFRAVHSLLQPGGYFVVQTLHPVEACGDQPYADGWRPGSWEGFSQAFRQPAPWYFRTMESWRALFQEHGLPLTHTSEPCHPATGKAVSVIFTSTTAKGR